MKRTSVVATLLLACGLAFISPAIATTIQIVWGEGYDARTLVAPLPNNPGRTLGEQRQIAHKHVVKLVERIVWIPDHLPLASNVSWTDLDGACGQSGSENIASQEEAIGSPLALRVLQGKSKPNKSGSRFRVEYADKPLDLSLHSARGLVFIGLHEFVHNLGFSETGPWRVGSLGLIGLYDTHLRLPGLATSVPEMNQTQLNRLRMAGEEVLWDGPKTSAAALRELMAGHVNGQVRLYTGEEFPRARLSHLSYDVMPRSIMSPTGGDSLELGIVAYMLADLGYGPVVDSEVMPLVATKDSPTSLTVMVDAMVRARVEDRSSDTASSVVVTATLPESPDGLRVENVVSVPLSCPTEATDGMVSCDPATLSGSMSIQYVFTGEPGIYEVEVDVDHQDNHVDPRPVNNFATVQVTVGVNTIEEVTLSSAFVAEGQAAGAEVGMLNVTSAIPGLEHTFALVDGGRHNACFLLEGDAGERLVTAKRFDREGAASLGIRIRARADNGFTREQGFTVEVTPAAVASGRTWSVAAHADTGGAAFSLRSLALAALLLFIAGYALRGGPGRSRGGRIALVLALLLLVASCGGGGGGSSSAPPAPPPPAFAC